MDFLRANNICKIKEELEKIKYKKVKSKKKRNKREYVNIPSSFDIETTSTYVDGEKFAFMYIWQLDIDDVLIIGRTWEEFIEVIKIIKEVFKVSENTIFVIYIHNMEFEFQFMRKYFEWDSVFSSTSRKPIYARTTDGIEFRCSYILSGYSLDNLAKNLQNKMEKKIGQLDYEKIRTSKTKLTEDEYEYCLEDVKIVVQFIREEIAKGENLADIPLTKTGYVRRYTRNNTVGKSQRYKGLIDNLTIKPEEYILLKKAFQGGFTHANANFSRVTLENISSYDFTSSYPAVMVSEEFPMSKGKKIENVDSKFFNKAINSFCCLFEIKMTDIKPLFKNEHILSFSKCEDVKNAVVDNGRIVSADSLKTIITEVDYKVLKIFYTFNEEIKEMIIYEKAYLPKELILSVLNLYVNKTRLKDVKDKNVEYQVSKGMLNSLFGMCVMDVVRDEIDYDSNIGWYEKSGNVNQQVDEYNNSGNRFLFYPWGVWITAYARRNLFTGIHECNDDFVYSDTDSVKIRNREKHLEYFNQYNNDIIEKIKKVLKFYKINTELAEPETIDKIKKPLGVWDYEGTYEYFKTIGAKRYMMYTEEKGLEITVAGLNKENTVKYLTLKYKGKVKRIFRDFDDGMKIPEDYSGKLTHTYIDDEKTAIIKDYKGDILEVTSKSAVHLEKSSCKIGLSDAYIDYLLGINIIY